MSLSYAASPNLTFDQYQATLILSHRDATIDVPINFVTFPAVDVTTACFGNATYDRGIAQQCISNLIAIQFRRLVFDIYWDYVNRRYQLCPVSYPINPAPNTTTISATVTGGPRNILLTPTVVARSVEKRQNQTTSATSRLFSNSTSQTLPTTTASVPYSTSTNSDGDTIIQVGRYQCNTNLTLDSIFSIYSSYIQNTSSTIEGRVLYVDFNLHAAIPLSNVSGSSQMLTGSQLPNPSELVGTVLSNNYLSGYVYTPSELQSDRQNLNSSWYNSRWSSSWAAPGYMTTYNISGGDIATTDGWPTEPWLVFSQLKRIITSWSYIDPQMSGYNFAGDNNTIFAINYTAQERSVSQDADGTVTSGCLYDAGQTQQMESFNDAWAYTVLAETSTTGNINSTLGYDIITNLTACGLSPYLNSTLDGSSAYDGWQPYSAFAQAASSAWGYGQPATSSNGASSSTPGSSFRCAIINPGPAYRGHWQVSDCNNKFRVACRINNNPFTWTLSDNAVVYNDGPNQCSGTNKFDFPRTELENTYLYNHILNVSRSSNTRDTLPAGIWINYNSIDIEGCWVTGGPQATCPYYLDSGAERQREVLIPTIGALVVLILTVLTILIKCGKNRRNSKHRRSGDGGWDYEGVPS